MVFGLPSPPTLVSECDSDWADSLVEERKKQRATARRTIAWKQLRRQMSVKSQRNDSRKTRSGPAVSYNTSSICLKLVGILI